MKPEDFMNATPLDSIRQTLLFAFLIRELRDLTTIVRELTSNLSEEQLKHINDYDDLYRWATTIYKELERSTD